MLSFGRPRKQWSYCEGETRQSTGDSRPSQTLLGRLNGEICCVLVLTLLQVFYFKCIGRERNKHEWDNL